MDPKITEWASRLTEVLEGNESFLLSGHVNIDGDSLGSMLGMLQFLRQRGKQVVGIVYEEIAERYAFLGGERFTEIFDPVRHQKIAREADVFMMFDFSATSRMPGLWDLVKEGQAFKVCVDHHVAESLPGDLNLHMSTAPATGKIVLDLIRAMGGTIDRSIAEPLFVAISTDTGWFRYSNTGPQSLHDAADLLGDELVASAIYREIYQRNELSLIRLMGRVLAEVHAEKEGQLLWATIPMTLIDELGTGPFETDELLDIMRTSREAECVALFRELPDGIIRVNLRSRGRIDVSELARLVGGGGHRHAGGTTMEGPLDEVAERVVKMARDALAAADRPEQTGSPEPSPLS